MAKVYVTKDLSLEDALRKFKKQVQKEGILLDIKRKEYFRTPKENAEFKNSNKKKKKKQLTKWKNYGII